MKTHQSAVVAMPPESVWEPIQRIRNRYDKKIDRWMPHINLLYPFVPQTDFEDAAVLLAKAVANLKSFDVTLKTFHSFEHNPHRFTMWLDPEPSDPFIPLQNAIQEQFPECNEVSNFPGGFKPHLSVGQASSRPELQERLDAIRAEWTPIPFTVAGIAIIHRDGNVPYKVDRWVPLGGEATSWT